MKYNKRGMVFNEIDTAEVYIVLSQTNTYPARLIRLYTKEPYSHVSISLDPRLEEMYSFARRGLYNPLNAGFVEEDIETGVFGKKHQTVCNIYKVTTTIEKYQRLKEEINNFKSNEEYYSYNFLGLLGVMMKMPVHTGNRFFCSQFVSYVLNKSEIIDFKKHCALVTPMDFRSHEELTLVYHGRLKEYRSLNYQKMCI